MVYPSWNIEESFRWLIRYVKYMVALAILTGCTIPFIPSIGLEEKVWAIGVIGLGVLVTIGLMRLAKVRKYTLASRGFMIVLYLVVTGVVFEIGGIKTLAVDIYYLLILSTGIFLDKRAHYVYLCASILTIIGFWYAEYGGYYKSEIAGDINDIAFVIVPIGVMCAVGAIGRRVVLLLTGKSEILEAEVQARTKSLESARKLAEERKAIADQRTDQMESFLANMSHEMRTPLTSILGGVDMLDKVPKVEMGEVIDVVKNASRRMLVTFDSVLELNRLENSDEALSTEMLEIAPIIYEWIDNLDKIRDGVELIVSMEQGSAEINEAAFRRVIENVIGNAIKYTQSGKVIVRQELNDRTMTIIVKDTGIGIDREFLPKIFEKYQQESSGYSREYEGSGIGLYVAKNLLEKMGGSITVNSTKGQGSTFAITLASVKNEEAQPVTY